MSHVENESYIARLSRKLNQAINPELTEADEPGMVGFFLFHRNAQFYKVVPKIQRYKRAFYGEQRISEFFKDNWPRFLFEYPSVYYLLSKGFMNFPGFVAITSSFVVTNSISAAYCGSSPLAYGLINNLLTPAFAFGCAMVAGAKLVGKTTLKLQSTNLLQSSVQGMIREQFLKSKPFLLPSLGGLVLTNFALAYSYKYNTVGDQNKFLASLGVAGLLFFLSTGNSFKALWPFLMVNYCFPLTVDHLLSSNDAEKLYYKAVEDARSLSKERVYE